MVTNLDLYESKLFLKKIFNVNGRGGGSWLGSFYRSRIKIVNIWVYEFFFLFFLTTTMSQVLQYFRSTWGTIWQVQMLLLGIGKVMSHTGLWDAKLTWYSPSVSLWHKHVLGIHYFRFTWLSRFLLLEWNVFIHLVTVLSSTTSSPFAR